MSRLLLFVIAAAFCINAQASEGIKDSDRDTTKFCYHAGLQYSRGDQIVAPGKAGVLTCLPDPNGIGVWSANAKDQAAPALQWVNEKQIKGK